MNEFCVDKCWVCSFAEHNKKGKNRKYVEKLVDIVLQLDNPTIASIEEKILSVKSNKTRIVQVYKLFLRYIRREYAVAVESFLPKNYETTTRRIELIKYLHEQRTRKDILKEFAICERTLNEDLRELYEGIEFAGAKLRINTTKFNRDGNYSVDDDFNKSTCNPIALPLDMTELFFLTNVLTAAVADKKMISDEYESILEKIYPQLSNYALRLIGKSEMEYPSRDFVFEKDSINNNALHKLFYTVKTAGYFTFVYMSNGKRKSVVGKMVAPGSDSFRIITENGDYEVINNSDFIDIENFDYK